MGESSLAMCLFAFFKAASLDLPFNCDEASGAGDDEIFSGSGGAPSVIGYPSTSYMTVELEDLALIGGVSKAL